jgi:hypothetical protein
MAFVADAAPLKFVPDAPPPKPAAPVTNAAVGGKETTEGPLGFANGLAELVGKGFGNIPMGAVHGIADIVSRMSGQGARPPSAPTFPLSANAQSVGQGIGDTLDEAAKPYSGIPALEQPIKEYVAPVLGDAAAVAPALGVAGRVMGAIREASDAARVLPKSAAVDKYGLVTGGAHPIARNVAGTSARPTATAANQSIADPVLGSQVGIPPGQDLSPSNFETGRGPANSVYNRLENSLPTAPLSPKAAGMTQGIGSEDLVTHSPDTVSQIEAQKARLLSGPITGPQAVNTSKSLRFNGFSNVASDDPEQVAVGRAQLKMADALHQHMLDTLPANSDVSVEQLEGARRALAQSHTLQPFVKGGNVDLQRLAKFGRDNPGLLSGPMADFADFADKHPEVSSLPSNEERFNPPGVLKDVTDAHLIDRPIGAVAQLFGGNLARKALTRGAGAPATPVTGLAGEFGPIDHGPPQPPPGMTASPPTGAPPAAAGPPGQIPLADLLSHGVEQPSPQGLSSGPMGSPAQSGIPFARNAEHEAGDLSLADAWASPTDMSLSPAERAAGRERTAAQRTGGDAQSEPEIIPRGAAEREGEVARRNNQDLASVMSSNVPDNIMARSPSPFANRGGSDVGSLKAASPEAINRGTRNVLEVDPDGNASPVLKDVSQIDAKAPKGHLLIDGDTHEIIDRGGLPLGHAKGLLNRWRALSSIGQEPRTYGGQSPLGAEF